LTYYLFNKLTSNIEETNPKTNIIGIATDNIPSINGDGSKVTCIVSTPGGEIYLKIIRI
jgi:hypothetical protein